MIISRKFHLKAGQTLLAIMTILLIGFGSIATAGPLHDAASSGDTAKVKRLLDGGADINEQGKHEYTPLHWAANNGKTKTAKLLLDRGANVNIKDVDGWPPLYSAVYYKNYKIAKMLIKAGTDVNMKNKNDFTILYAAAWNGDLDTVKLLIEHGAELNAKNSSGSTALDVARSSDKTEAAEYLQGVTDGTISPNYVYSARRKPTAPPYITTSLAFTEPSGNKILDAEETGTLTITVNNSGKGDAYDVKVKVSANRSLTGLSYSKTLKFKTVAAGKAKKYDLKLTSNANLPTSDIAFTVETIEANGFDALPVKLSFNTKAFAPPNLIVADMAIADQSRNSRIEPMEMVSMTVRVQNIGHGDARNVTVNVMNGKNVFIGGDGESQFKIGNLNSGQHQDVEFMIYTNMRIKNGEKIPVDIGISESRGKYGTRQPLKLVMNVKQKNVSEIIVKGRHSGPLGAITLAKGLSVDVDQDLPNTKMKNKNAIAVVIGNSNYQKTKGVEFAINDAKAIRMYLTEVLGYRDGNILFKEDATKGDFELYFGNKDTHEGRLFELVKPGKSDVFIYYSGHGAPGLRDKKGYFVPVEADPNHMELTGYAADTFYNNLSKLRAKSMTVVLDACFSGSDILKNISPMVVEIENPTLKMKNAVVISSSQGSQVSSWYNQKKHGMFTYFFLKAIHDKNADYNNDKQLTMDEIYRFVSDEADGVPYYARREHSVTQTPTIEGQYKDRVLVKY